MEENKFYITKQKLQELKEEYKDLLALEDRKTKGEVPKLFESEDVSSEYLDFQEDLSLLCSRIEELENILKNYEIIKKPSKDQQSVVGIGSTVAISIDGEKDEFVIVGTLEANPALGKISNESLVGKALLGHRAGEKIVISSPIKTTYTIKKIRYLFS